MDQRNKEEVSLLEAILEGVTPGPWRASRYNSTVKFEEWYIDGGGRTLVNVFGYEPGVSAEANARFIALARDLVPQLFAMIYELDDKIFEQNDEIIDLEQVRKLVDHVQLQNDIAYKKIESLEAQLDKKTVALRYASVAVIEANDEMDDLRKEIEMLRERLK